MKTNKKKVINKRKTNKSKKVSTTEISRWFTMKVNLGNFENVDIGASQKLEVPVGKEEEYSEKIYQFVKNQVLKSVNQYKKADNKKIEDVSKEEAELDAE